MCWNKSVSLNTFFFGLFAIAFSFGNKLISATGVFALLSFISMQLVEYFAWDNLNNKETLALISKAGLSRIIAQPVISGFYLPTSIGIPYWIAYAFFIAASFLVVYPSNNINFSMHKAVNGHLAWDWLEWPQILIFIWLSFIIFCNAYDKNYSGVILLLLTFIISYITYYKTNTWGSVWCWIVNFYSVYLITRVFIKEFC